MPSGSFSYRGRNSSYWGCDMNTNDFKPRYIRSYNYIPDEFVFHRIRDEEELYLGVELEIDEGGEDENNAKCVYEFMNSDAEHIYCKHDGSLSDGFEIVTHPCTLDYHKQLKYRELFLSLVDKGYRSHDTTTCGMHVHINRTYFGKDKLTQDLCIGKLLYIYEKYWDKVELISRRKSNGYARRFLLEENETLLDLYAKSKESNKYGAINLKHKDTVEVRIFKGTLNCGTFISTLEFVEIMARIAKETDIYEIQFVTWNKIKNNFSNKLSEYILDREEAKRKTDEDKISQQNMNVSVNLSRVLDRDRSMGLLMEVYRNLTNQMNPSIENNIWGSSNQAPVTETLAAISSEDRLRREITDMRSRVRRCRNGLEERNMNREIARMEDELRRMRRNNH